MKKLMAALPLGSTLLIGTSYAAPSLKDLDDLYRTGDYDGVITVLEETTRNDDPSLLASDYLGIAIAYYKKGNTAKMREYLNLAKENLSKARGDAAGDIEDFENFLAGKPHRWGAVIVALGKDQEGTSQVWGEVLLGYRTHVLAKKEALNYCLNNKPEEMSTIPCRVIGVFGKCGYLSTGIGKEVNDVSYGTGGTPEKTRSTCETNGRFECDLPVDNSPSGGCNQNYWVSTLPPPKTKKGK
jgi:hypothetical protein